MDITINSIIGINSVLYANIINVIINTIIDIVELFSHKLYHEQPNFVDPKFFKLSRV